MAISKTKDITEQITEAEAFRLADWINARWTNTKEVNQWMKQQWDLDLMTVKKYIMGKTDLYPAQIMMISRTTGIPMEAIVLGWMKVKLLNLARRYDGKPLFKRSLVNEQAPSLAPGGSTKESKGRVSFTQAELQRIFAALRATEFGKQDNEEGP